MFFYRFLNKIVETFTSAFQNGFSEEALWQVLPGLLIIMIVFSIADKITRKAANILLIIGGLGVISGVIAPQAIPGLLQEMFAFLSSLFNQITSVV